MQALLQVLLGITVNLLTDHQLIPSTSVQDRTVSLINTLLLVSWDYPPPYHTQDTAQAQAHAHDLPEASKTLMQAFASLISVGFPLLAREGLRSTWQSKQMCLHSS